MEWLLIGALALALSGAPRPGPTDFGPPVTAYVELVSLRMQPASGFAGTWAYGYLGLRPVVADSPTRPVEELEGWAAYGFVPAIGLRPLLWCLAADGRWHEPALKDSWRTLGMRDPAEVYRTPLKLYPLVRPVGPRRAGYAGIWVSAYLKGLGWQEAQEVWVNPAGAQGEITWQTPYGVLRAFMQVRPSAR